MDETAVELTDLTDDALLDTDNPTPGNVGVHDIFRASVLGPADAGVRGSRGILYREHWVVGRTGGDR